jgi:type IV secretory pathway VirB2 component (pilin)
MKPTGSFGWKQGRRLALKGTLALASALVLAGPLRAQAAGNSPWENAVNVLQQSFTGPIARGLALIALVIGGLTFAFGEGGAKRTFAGIIFGIGMAVLAVNFLTWLFGV